SAQLHEAFASLSRSAAQLSQLSFPVGSILPQTVLSSVASFETHLIRDADPHELALFQPNDANLDYWASTADNNNDLNRVAGGQDADTWTAAKRQGPRRVETAKDKASPLKDLSSKGSTADPDRCLRAAQKLLEIYPLPRASEHVEALHAQWLGLTDSIVELEGSLRRPPSRANPAIQHDESYYRLLSLEDEIKREELELLALEQFKQDREAELAALKPTIRHPGPAARKVQAGSAASPRRPAPRVPARFARPSVGTALFDDERPPAPETVKVQSRQSPSRSERPGDDQASALPAVPRPRSPEPPRRVRPSIPSAVPTPRSTAAARRSLAPAAPAPLDLDVEPVHGNTSRGQRSPASVGSPSRNRSREATASPTPVGKRLPEGVHQEDLDAINASVWRLMGDSLRPWAKRWCGEEGKALGDSGPELPLEDTISMLDKTISIPPKPENPSSPSSASISSYAANPTADEAGSGPPAPSVLVEFKLLHLLLSTLSSPDPLPHPASLPHLPIIFRDPPADSTATESPSSALTKTPCLSMNGLKAHVTAFATERGWTEGMGTTAIYSLISRQVARIDRRGREGAVVGFKV
ncbi:hypothetical protein JCM10212_004164, partial [Sporobolomyces blumeae]